MRSITPQGVFPHILSFLSFIFSFVFLAPIPADFAAGYTARTPVRHGDGEVAAAAPGTLKWAYVTGGPITASPAIGGDGTIYVGSYDNKLYAVNPKGTFKWSYGTGIITMGVSIGPDGTIYAGSNDKRVYAIRPDGTLKWSYEAGDSVLCTPAIAPDGTIYVGLYNQRKLYAVNPDGSFKWSYTTGGMMTSSPAIGTDGTVYVGCLDKKLYAVNPDGTLKWSYATKGEIWSSPAIGADGTIYVGADDAKLHAVNPDGTFKWSYDPGGANIHASPSIGTDGTVYVGMGGDLHAINPDGTFKWSYATGFEINCAPAVGFDGTIYVGSRGLFAVNPDGTLKWSYSSDGMFIRTSSPAIGPDGTVYIGSDNDHKLHAISSSSSGLAGSPWPMFHHDTRHTGLYGYSDDSATLSLSISGSGSVVSDPSGIDCGETCSASYSKGTVVTLTATAADGSAFTGWSGGCSGTGASCTVTMNADLAVTATFGNNLCTYNFSPRSRKFTHKSGKVTINITAKGAKACPKPVVQVTEGEDWITLSSFAFNKNKGKAVVTVPANSTSSNREGGVSIAGGSFPVTQTGKPCTLAITPTVSTPKIPKAGGIGSFTVTASPGDCSWTATKDAKATWLSITSGGSGTGNGNVFYTADENTGKSARSGKVTVSLATGKAKKVHTVKQTNK